MSSEVPSPVWFTRCADSGDAPAAALGRLLAESGLLAADAVRGKRVLVKPNLLTDRTPDEAVTTHPDVLRPVLRHLKAAGADVSVGDSPASTANLRSVLEKSGLVEKIGKDNFCDHIDAALARAEKQQDLS